MMSCCQPDPVVTGSQPSDSENTKINMSPSQKLGIETPESAATVLRESSHPWGRSAARVPRAMPSTTAMPRPTSASSRVNGSTFAISRPTGSPYRIDRPRRPRRSAASSSTYWRHNGRSSPYSWRSDSSCDLDALPSEISSAGSEGSTCSTRNTSV
jgi:hypothetical protein